MPATSPTTRNFLIPGEDYLARKPGFRLVGRDRELQKLTGILMRRSGHNVLLVGAGGVACSAICLGLQELKNSEDAPLDIVGKRIFWLDTDGLFSSGDHAVINEGFRKLMGVLTRTSNRDTLLILEDARVFIDAAKISGCTHFINAIMKAVKAGEFQIILEVRDEDLELVLKTHVDVGEAFTMMDVQEPDDSALVEIVMAVCRDLEKHHGIAIGEDAISTAIELTGKYRVRDMSLSRAQPERALNLIDRALASYRQSAHTYPPAIARKRAACSGLAG